MAFPEKEKDTGDDNYWKPGDEASLGGIFDDGSAQSLRSRPGCVVVMGRQRLKSSTVRHSSILYL